MHHANCLNCDQLLHDDQNFCPRCGQTTNTHRLTVGHVSHEFFHAFTHADSGILLLIKGLALNPGLVAAEYVAGKVKKYYSPFSFLLICIGFFVLVNNIIKTYPDTPPPDPKIIEMLPTAKAKQNYIHIMERTAAATKAVNKHANIITVIAIPLYAFILWLFFKRRKRNFAEIMVAVILFTAFANLCTTVIFNPLLSLYKGKAAYFYIFLVAAFLQSLYYAWGFKYFFHYHSIWGYIKVWLVMVLTFVVWTIITGFGFFFFIYRSKTFAVLGALWDHYFK